MEEEISLRGLIRYWCSSGGMWFSLVGRAFHMQHWERVLFCLVIGCVTILASWSCFDHLCVYNFYFKSDVIRLLLSISYCIVDYTTLPLYLLHRTAVFYKFIRHTLWVCVIYRCKTRSSYEFVSTSTVFPVPFALKSSKLFTTPTATPWKSSTGWRCSVCMLVYRSQGYIHRRCVYEGVIVKAGIKLSHVPWAKRLSFSCQGHCWSFLQSLASRCSSLRSLASLKKVICFLDVIMTGGVKKFKSRLFVFSHDHRDFKCSSWHTIFSWDIPQIPSSVSVLRSFFQARINIILKVLVEILSTTVRPLCYVNISSSAYKGFRCQRLAHHGKAQLHCNQ